MVGRIPVMEVMPVVDLGRQPAKATVGEPLPVRATVFREGHDRLGAEVVLIDPQGRRRPPVRMTEQSGVPDRYTAWVTPDQPGAWSFEVQAWSSPLGTWFHDGPVKIRAGVDVELMFTEGRLLIERVRASLDPKDPATPHVVQLLDGAIEAAADTGRPVAARLAALEDPALIAATASSRLAAVRKLPLVTFPVWGSFVAPSERGKNSYQLLNSAFGRSAYAG